MHIPTKTDIRRRLIAVGCGLLIYTAFLACYGLVIVPLYGYAGLIFRMLDAQYWALSLVLALIPMLIMPLDLQRPSDFASWALYLFLVLPACIVIFMSTNYTASEIAHLPAVLVGVFLIFEYFRRARIFKIPKVVASEKLFALGLPLLMLALTFVIFRIGGFKISLSLADAYDRRSMAREMVPSGFLVGYALTFLQCVCVPIAVVIGIERKKWFLLALSALAIISITSLNGTKSSVLQPVVLAFVTLLAMKRRKNTGFIIIATCLFVIIFAIVEFYTVGSYVVAELLIRRAMAIPGQLTAYYYEYFSQNPHTMMADGVFGKIFPVESPYALSKSRMIGAVFFGNTESNANANMWASGFADFGYLGMVAVSFIAAMLLRLADSMANNGRFVLACACCSAMGLTWADGALHTSLLSNGILGLLIALWLFPSSRNETVIQETSTVPSQPAALPDS